MVNSHNEWDKLEEVIVGDGFPSSIPTLDLSFQLFFHDNIYEENTKNRMTSNHYVKTQYIEEMKEDVEGFVDILKDYGCVVKRPKIPNKIEKIKTPYWNSTNFHALNTRDLILIIGDEIIETPSTVRHRYFETDLMKHLFMEYFKEGAKWTTAPKPIMTDASFDMSYILKNDPNGSIEKWYEEFKGKSSSYYDYGYEMMFDAANCMRFGRDIIFNVATENHKLGAKWLQRHLGENYKVHEVALCDGHIDSTIIPLRPGLLLVDWHHFKGKETLPSFMQSWDIITAPENPNRVLKYDLGDLKIATPSIDINVLSLDQNTLVCHDEYHHLLQPLLKPYGIEAIPCKLRHSEIFAGAFHCISLDIRRKSKLESYD